MKKLRNPKVTKKRFYYNSFYYNITFFICQFICINTVFNNPVLISEQIVSRCRFTCTVTSTTDGVSVDAVVTITAIVNARLDTFDNATNGNLPDRSSRRLEISIQQWLCGI
jgi:hypothetical protein